jgi:hypothetical protein
VIQFDEEKDEVVFSSGRRAYAYTGVLGICLVGDTVGMGASGPMERS